MKGEVTVIIESAEEGGYRAYCPEVAGASGQSETIEEVKTDLAAAIQLILKDRIDGTFRGLPDISRARYRQNCQFF